MGKGAELAERLIGTAGVGVIVEEELDSAEDLAEYDRLCFCCEVCGWYSSTDELNNDGPRDLCDQCNEKGERE
jgi:hypothetical protein